MSFADIAVTGHHDLFNARKPMHSFFRPIEKAPSGNSQADCCSSNKQDLPQANIPCAETSSMNTNVAGPFMHVDEQHSVSDSNHQSILQPYRVHDLQSEIYDPVGDRRKRRKVSTERDEEQSQSRDETPTPLATNGSPKVIAEQLGSHESTTVVSDVPTTISSAPKRPRGRPPKSSLSVPQTEKVNTLQAVKSVGEATIDINPPHTSSPKSRRTPRKKTLQIGANGTLLPDGPKPMQEHRSPRPVTANEKVKGKSLTLKNGKFAQSLVVKIKYNQKDHIGARIDKILSTPKTVLTNDSEKSKIGTTASKRDAHKSTHPFFLAKREQHHTHAKEDIGIGLTQQTNEVKNQQEIQKPTPWKDLVFSSKRSISSKTIHPREPPWPPRTFQHVGSSREPSTRSTIESSHRSKQKTRAHEDNIDSDSENVLARYTRQLISEKSAERGLRCPHRLYCTAEEAICQFPDQQRLHESSLITSALSKALSSTSAFDRAEASGPLPWIQQYSPTTYEEVLQPSCEKLYQWLKSLAVHNVKQGLDKTSSKRIPKKKKKPKKRDDELYDFIVDDEEEQEDKRIKNAILITGPNGCGKTASVYAVAKQLGFEVFEIHAGMRRSQKDIFDKVGDMTQNHMVQGASVPSRDSSVLHDPDSAEESNQQSLTSFLARSGNKSLHDPSRHTTPQPPKEQKQSLILFEEVDQIFEEDRGFWPGVLSLIQNSRRPVVLTCNDFTNIPIEELELYATLTYSVPPPDLVTRYLTCIAAAEGHILDPKAVQSLYCSKGNDLRATITELDFWCQMTVGSTRGGLDWFPQYKSDVWNIGRRPRTFSKDTFVEGLDLLPLSSNDTEDNIRFMDEGLQITVDEWFERTNGSYFSAQHTSVLQGLCRSEFLSDATLMDSSVQPLFAAGMCEVGLAVSPNPEWIVETKTSMKTTSKLYEQKPFFDCILPLSIEKPVFPPAQGRLAPSLDSPQSTMAVDIAPYVRSICAFDLRLEQEREEVFSSQGKKTRMTKAARAAAEGGDKANTRRDRWFPPELNLREVLKTGSNWPQWFQHDYFLEGTEGSDQGEMTQGRLCETHNEAFESV